MNIIDIILTYVYQQLTLGDFKYKILKTEEDLLFLKGKQHYIAPNYYGYNNLLVFTKYKNDPYSVFIDRTTLKYSKDKLDLSRVKIQETKIYTTMDFYNGTILDGILTTSNGRKTYIITDVYYVAGQSFVKREYKEKMKQIKDIINTKIKQNKNSDNIDFYVDDVRTYMDLETLVDYKNNKINSSNNFNSRGLIFYPCISGQKFIYTIKTNNNSGITGNQKSLNVNNNNRLKSDKKFESSSSSDDTSSSDESSDSDCKTIIKKEKVTDKQINLKNPKVTDGTFLMKKTITSDVFELFLNDGKKTVRIGIAHISGIAASKKCRKFFEDEEDEEVIVDCVWNKKFEKWMPDCISDNKIDALKTIYD